VRALLDTSVWVDHLRHGDGRVTELLEDGRVVIHPFVIGELALGNLRARARVLGLMRSLPSTPVATEDEVLHLINQRKLVGRGIGYVDAHLIAAALLGENVVLWSRDRRLSAVADALGVAYHTQ